MYNAFAEYLRDSGFTVDIPQESPAPANKAPAKKRAPFGGSGGNNEPETDTGDETDNETDDDPDHDPNE